MPLRPVLLATALSCGALLAPFAAPAAAAPTTSTVVAYQAFEDWTPRLYTRPADGSGSPTVMEGVRGSRPRLSPDGTRVAYSGGDGQVERIFVRAVDGTGPGTALSNGPFDFDPAWSPDGSTIAFTREGVEGDQIITHVYTVPAAGGPETLVPGTAGAWFPSFSPSGQQIVVTRRYPGPSVLEVVNVANGERATVPGTTDGSRGIWSPDGRTIVFLRAYDTCYLGLVSVPATGGTRTRLRVQTKRAISHPAFSRDGSQLFWNERPATCYSAGSADIWSGNADATGAAPVAVTPEIDEKGADVAGGTPPVDTAAPPAPVIAAAGAVTATSATIAWNAPAPDATRSVVVRVPHGAAAPATPAEGTFVYDGPARTATATGLDTGSAHDLYVFAIDASGNVSPPSAAHPVRPSVPPVVAGMGNVALLSATNTFPVRWSGSAAEYQVEIGAKTRSYYGVWSADPVYRTLVASTTATTTTFTGAQGTSYYFRVKGADGFGNWAYSVPKSASVPLDERYYALAYSAGWATETPAAGRWLDSVRSTTAAGRTMSGKFETSSYRVVGDMCRTCGKFEVWVDGVRKATVDTYAASTRTRVPLWTSGSYGTVRPHTIKLVALGTAGRSRVGIDAVGLTR